MFQLSTRRDRIGRTVTEHERPLLGSPDFYVADDRSRFSLQDSDDENEPTALGAAKPDHGVRFEEEVQVIGPPLRSTLASREAGVYVGHSPSSPVPTGARHLFMLWL